MQMADLIVHEGYRDLGYNLISLDDCWMARTRDAQGRLQPDPYRFPSGIKALGDYVSFLSQSAPEIHLMEYCFHYVWLLVLLVYVQFISFIWKTSLI